MPAPVAVAGLAALALVVLLAWAAGRHGGGPTPASSTPPAPVATSADQARTAMTEACSATQEALALVLRAPGNLDPVRAATDRAHERARFAAGMSGAPVVYGLVRDHLAAAAAQGDAVAWQQQLLKAEQTCRQLG